MSKKNKEQKKTYLKPELQKIDLAADEVMALGCKTSGTPGSTPGGATCGLGAVCSALGS